MNEVRIGIIGIGNMGSAHAKSILAGNVKGLNLAAICDIDEEKIAWAKVNLPGVTCYSDYQEMITSKTIDAVLIATPHYLHPEIAIFAFSKGLHVLSEKPAGVYTKQVEEMNEAAKKSGKVFAIMYNQRTNPLFRKAREIVQSGRLGQPKRLVWLITNWYRSQAYYDSGTWRATWAGEGGGVLINQCPHNLDLWQWIFGMPVRVRGFCAYGKYHNVEIEDDVTAYAEYENGASAVFITTTGECPGTNRLEISGDKAKLVIEDGKLRLWELDTPERELCFTTQNGFPKPEVQYSEILLEEPETAHNGILQNFSNSILHGEALISPGEEGIKGLTISNAIHLSDWTDGWANIHIDKELFLARLNEHIAASKQKESVRSQFEDIRGTYNSRWDIKW